MQSLKSEQRRMLRARRLALSRRRQMTAARALAARVASSRFFKASRRIACYVPRDGEIDPRPLAARAAAAGKICYFPVLQLRARRLLFAPARPGVAWRRNRYGIPEPLSRPRLRARDLDLIVMPLVAFDVHGNRVGMGAGYYDRSLAGLRARKGPRLLGVAHDFQRLERIASDAWDVPLDVVATERALYLMPRRRA